MNLNKRKNFLEINNEFLKLRFYIEDNKQEFFVKNENSWKTILIVPPPILSFDEEEINFKLKLKDLKKNPKFIRVIFSGNFKNHSFETSVFIKEKCKYVRIVNEYSIKGKIKIEYLKSVHFFAPEKKLYCEYKPLDFSWVPNLRPGKNYVIGDHCFRSPALILQKGKFLVSLIPDIELLKKERKMKTSLDFRIYGFDFPFFSYGFEEYKNIGHTYYIHKRSMRYKLENENLIYGYYLYLDGESEKGKAHQEIVRFIWNKFGEKYFKNSKLPVIPYDEYVRYGYSYIFRNNYILKEFEINNKKCAGIYTISFTSSKKPKILNKRELNYYLKFKKIETILHKIFSENLTSSPVLSDIMEIFIHNTENKIVPQIMNQAWFNNVRTGYGIYYYGKKWKDEKLISFAKKIKNLILNTPQNFGIFPSVCFTPEKEIIWEKGTKGFEYVPYYHTPDNSTTCYWILQWYKDLERDKKLLNICKNYAEFLIKIQLSSGAIPAWVDIDRSGKIDIKEELKESASTSCSTMFLSELYLIEKKKKYLNSLEKGADFLIKEVIPENKWYDFETFFSCSKKEINMKDKYTGIYPQNTLSIHWSCETFKNLYKITKKEIYLEYGKICLDLLSLYQQIWDANFLSIYTFGGFGVMNTDAEWNDARQALFSLTYFDYYSITKNPEYLKRAISALNSSFLLMVIPEHREIAAGNIPEKLRKEYYGAIYENYAHLGYDRRVPGYVMVDWGIGTSCTAMAIVEQKYLKFFKEI
jgi:hypothetical protein